MVKRIIASLALGALLFSGCNGSSSDDIDEGIDIIDGVERKPIEKDRTGANAFLNDSRFGSIDQQLNDIRGTLGIKSIRILFAWNNSIQSSPSAAPDFSFYDDIANSLPGDVEAFAVLTGVPSWMSDQSNWIEGDPRKTFVQKWVRPVVSHFRGNGRIAGFQIWNEPNMESNPDNQLLGLANNPANYVALLGEGFSTVKDISSGKFVLNAATTSINQNFPETLDYNRAMVEAGALNFVDRYAIHYYGRQFENVILSGGVADFLNNLGKTIWVTESGAPGFDMQLGYVEEVWPFLREKIPAIDRFYYYQYAEAKSAQESYGLRNSSSSNPVSDLYVYLKEN